MPSFHSNFKCRSIFIDYLNTICSNNHHLLTILPELRTLATNRNLILAIDEYVCDNDKHIVDLLEIFELMHEPYLEKKVLGIRMIAFEAYKAAFYSTETNLEKDSAILLYLEIIDSVEILYFRTLINMCKELRFKFANLQSSYDTAVDNMVLFERVRTELLALN